MAIIYLPSQLSQLIDEYKITLNEPSLSLCFAKLIQQYPQLEPYFLNHKYKRFYNVYVNGAQLKNLDQEYLLSKEDKVDIVFNLAGG